MSILKCMVEWSKDQYVNPNSQTSLGEKLMLPNVMHMKIIIFISHFTHLLDVLPSDALMINLVVT